MNKYIVAQTKEPRNPCEVTGLFAGPYRSYLDNLSVARHQFFGKPEVLAPWWYQSKTLWGQWLIE